jgi:hypothetical protein
VAPEHFGHKMLWADMAILEHSDRPPKLGKTAAKLLAESCEKVLDGLHPAALIYP